MKYHKYALYILPLLHCWRRSSFRNSNASGLATCLLPTGHWIGCNEEMKFDLLSGVGTNQLEKMVTKKPWTKCQIRKHWMSSVACQAEGFRSAVLWTSNIFRRHGYENIKTCLVSKYVPTKTSFKKNMCNPSLICNKKSPPKPKKTFPSLQKTQKHGNQQKSQGSPGTHPPSFPHPASRSRFFHASTNDPHRPGGGDPWCL